MTFRTPSYRLHKPSGQAVVTICGRDYYLGRWNTPQSHAEYDRLIAEWLANGRRLRGQDATPSDITVTEVILAFDKYAEQRYPLSGRELENFRLALQPLRELYGHTPVRNFGPKALKAVQQHMNGLGWCRTVINRRVGRIKTVFKWAESEELIPASTYHALQTVRGLPKGMAGVKEPAPIEPAFWEQAEKVIPFCPRTVATMVCLQWLTGARSGEVRVMRTMDIDRSDPSCWYYRPGSDAGPHGQHKNAWRGQDRVVVLGPQAIAAVTPWLRENDPQAFLFQPRQAVEERNARRRAERKTPRTPSQLARKRKTKPKRVPGVLYSSTAYAHAVARACAKANVRFRPYALRHGRKMQVEAAIDVDAARAVLGQKSIHATQHYGRLDLRKAAEVMAKLG
jgi:integrase